MNLISPVPILFSRSSRHHRARSRGDLTDQWGGKKVRVAYGTSARAKFITCEGIRTCTRTSNLRINSAELLSGASPRLMVATFIFCAQRRPTVNASRSSLTLKPDYSFEDLHQRQHPWGQSQSR